MNKNAIMKIKEYTLFYKKKTKVRKENNYVIFQIVKERKTFQSSHVRAN